MRRHLCSAKRAAEETCGLESADMSSSTDAISQIAFAHSEFLQLRIRSWASTLFFSNESMHVQHVLELARMPRPLRAGLPQFFAARRRNHLSLDNAFLRIVFFSSLGDPFHRSEFSRSTLARPAAALLLVSLEHCHHRERPQAERSC